MIFGIPKLNDKDNEVIASIEESKQKLRYNTATSPKRWYGLLRRTTLARNIQGSNSIEGLDISRNDAIAAVAGIEPIDDPKDEAIKANRSYGIAMTYVLQLADDPYFSYSSALIKSLHYMMLEYDLTKSPGKWRPGHINVFDEEKRQVVYEGPDADLVPSLMDELVTFLNDSEKKVGRIVVAAMAHLNLVMIHPFRDGNGRMGRCLQTLVLATDGISLDPVFSSIEEYLGRNSRSYYDILGKVGAGKWHPDRDAAEWVRFCLVAHSIQIQKFLRRIRTMMRLWDILEQEVKTIGLPERVVSALTDAAMGIKVRNSTYRAAVESISDQVASRDLKDMVDKGLLIAFGTARGRYYDGSEKVKKIFTDSIDKTEIKSPYQP